MTDSPQRATRPPLTVLIVVLLSCALFVGVLWLTGTAHPTSPAHTPHPHQTSTLNP